MKVRDARAHMAMDEANRALKDASHRLAEFRHLVEQRPSGPEDAELQANLAKADRMLAEANAALAAASHTLAAGLDEVERIDRETADRLVDVYSALQSTLTSASQAVGETYEILRPSLIEHYVQTERRNPRWEETWPLQGDSAARSMDQIEPNASKGSEVDRSIAQLRWELGWPQQRIAMVVGLSQPAVATRLSRLESSISEAIIAEYVRGQSEREGFRPFTREGRHGQSAWDFALERPSDDTFVFMEAVVSDKRTESRMAEVRNVEHLMKIVRFEQRNEGMMFKDEAPVMAIAAYFRYDGEIGFYPSSEFAPLLRRGGAGADPLLRLREVLPPARTISELLERAHATKQENG